MKKAPTSHDLNASQASNPVSTNDGNNTKQKLSIKSIELALGIEQTGASLQVNSQRVCIKLLTNVEQLVF